MLRHSRCLFVAAVLIALEAGPAPGQPPMPTEPSPALRQEAAWYAEQNGIDLDEALRRLELERDLGPLAAALRKEEKGNFAGLWIEHEPESQVLLRIKDLTSDERVRERIARSPVTQPVEVRPARWSLADLEGHQAACRELASELDMPINSDINVAENRVEIYVVEPETLEAALAQAGLRLPEGATVVPVERLAKPNLSKLHGGVPLTACDDSVTIRRSNGDLGLTTPNGCGYSSHGG